MNRAQRESIYFAKRIEEVNQNPNDELDEKLDKLTFRDMLKLFETFPDAFLDLTAEEFTTMIIDGTGEEFIMNMLDSLTEEQIVALDAVMESIFS